MGMAVMREMQFLKGSRRINMCYATKKGCQLVQFFRFEGGTMSCFVEASKIATANDAEKK